MQGRLRHGARLSPQRRADADTRLTEAVVKTRATPWTACPSPLHAHGRAVADAPRERLRGGGRGVRGGKVT